MLAVLTFPSFDPVAISIGPFAIRWYALAYIVGILLAWRYCRWLASGPPEQLSARAIDDFLFWATIGIIIGGRLGYVLFYKPGDYLANPVEIVFIWRGGMSFHGGMLGVAAAILLFARSQKVHFTVLADIVAAAAPIGLFLGRIANFVNGELFGRPTDVAWGVVFPAGGPVVRHPSQIYEAGLEGIVLFIVLFVLVRFGALRSGGMLTGAFLVGYAVARLIAELFREPDLHIGFLAGGITMGQVLSLPMLLVGLGFIVWARRARR
ncbi:MAG TPA: prolipoprotein diacylglyceryl transferase [Kiloniellales bacterium]